MRIGWSGKTIRIPLPGMRDHADDRPIAWWEWPLVPVVWVGFTVVFGSIVMLSIPYFTVFPDHHPHPYDRGSSRQREIIRLYRESANRVPLWRRFGHALAILFRLAPQRRRYVNRQLSEREADHLGQRGLETDS